ncbi:MAG TPA: hypothetical protein VK597_14085, partial [Inquilinus sp.]|nr:hypothetical protein [Inquilinus sp.]
MVDRRALTNVDLRRAPALLQQPNPSINDRWAQFATDTMQKLGYDESAYSTGQRLADVAEYTPAGAATAAESVTKAAMKGNYGEAGVQAGLGLAGIAIPGARAGFKGAEKLGEKAGANILKQQVDDTLGSLTNPAVMFENTTGLGAFTSG